MATQTKIEDVMTHDPVALKGTDSVKAAAREMRDNDIGDVIVIDDEQKVCGIVTDRDIAVKVVAEDKGLDTQLSEFCSSDVLTVAPDDSVSSAVKMMSERAIRRLPVVLDGRPVGVVSLGDLAVERDPDSALADISAAPPNN